MAMSLIFGIRLTPHCFERVEVDGINFDGKVEHLRQEASKITNVPKNLLELVFCGNVLDDNATLKSYGLRPGVTVHVLKKKERAISRPKTMSEAEIQDLARAFQTFTRHPSYRSALQRLSRPDVMENIISSTPTLRNDPVALSILRDPVLLVNMDNVETVKRVAELHPALAEAATHIAAVIHEEAASAGNSSNQASGSGFQIPLEALSDDEEMDSSQSSDSQPRANDTLGPQPSSSGITAAQLAAALATATASPIAPRISSSGPSLGTSSSSSGALITSEMFNQAMQHAMGHANVLPSTSSDPSVSGSSSSTEFSADVEALSRRLSSQLLQMREMGLTDNAVNIQALQATGGDVQAAINLVFSGAITPDAH